MVSFTSTIKSVVMALALASSASAVPIEPRNNELDARGSYLQSQLFPAGGYSSASSWTTSTSLSPRFNLKAGLPIQKGKKPTTDKAPDGHSSIVSFFPAGSINPGNKDAPKGGFSFYSNGPSWGTIATAGTGVWQDDITRAKELTFGYSVFFQEGFQWNLGGKLPGVYGGSNEDIARSCSGGRQEDRDQCFSLRMMWRPNGAAEAYNYLPTSATQPESYTHCPPMSEINPAYGDSIGRGSFYFSGGSWNTIAQRVKLNDVGQANGELQIFINGESKINLSGLTLRTRGDVVFRGIQAQTFFGGHGNEWASPIDQTAWFKDWSMAIIN